MNHRTSILLTATALALAVPATAFAESLDFSDLGPFTSVSSSAGVTVTIGNDAQYQIVAEAENDKDLSHLDIHLDGSTLVITDDFNLLDFILEGGIVGALFGNSPGVIVDVTLPTLNSVEASSGSDVSVNSFQLGSLTAASSSGAGLNLNNVTAEAMNLHASSGAALRASGTCTTLAADASSGSDIRAAELVCVNGGVQGSSGANLTVNLSGVAEADASTGASITILGTPDLDQPSQSTGGSIKTGD